MLLPLTLLALAAAPPKPFTPVTSVEGITEYALPNGLRVLLLPDASKPKVTINVTYFVGSRHEGYGETGMAHLLEHMLYKQTKNRKDPKKELSDHGADGNATTSYDRTNYYETLNASDESLKWALEFEADRMVNALVLKSDLDTEMTVVRNEFESGESQPTSVLFERLLSTAFLWHNYGKSTIGAKSDIEGVPIDRLQDFYRRHYRPDNAMLVVAGKFDEAKAFGLIASAFGKVPRGKTPLQPTYTAEPTQDGERSVTVRRVGGAPVLMVGYHVPAGTDPDWAAVDMLQVVLGDSPSGRLYKALVETKKAARVGCSSLQVREPGYFFCFAELKANDPVEPAKAALIETVETLSKKPATPEEVDRARQVFAKQVELTLNSSERIGITLTEFAAMGDWRTLFLYRDRMKSTTPDELNAVVAKYLKASNRTLGEYVPTEKPDRAEVPPAPDVAALVKDYKGNAAVSAGEAFESTASNIEARTKRLSASSGLKVALLEKRTRGQTVALSLTIRYGSEKLLEGKSTAASFAAGMLERGTKKKTRTQFQDALDALNANLSFRVAPNGVVASLEVRRPNLEAALALLVEALKEPAFDAKEFEALRREVQAGIDKNRSEPTAVGFLATQRMMAPYPKGHPFYVQSYDEQAAATAAVTLEQAREFHALFYGSQAATVAAVGDFDTEQLGALLTSQLASWVAPKPYERIPQKYMPVAGRTEVLATPDKANAFLGAGINFPLKDSDPDYAALVLADYMLGGGFLTGRVTQRLREKEGLSYGAGTFLSAPALDDGARLIGYAIYAPQNVKKVEAGMREELLKAIESGFSDTELKAARPGILQERKQRLADDGALAGMLSQYLNLDRTLKFDESLDGQLGNLSAKDVSAALKKHVAPGDLAIVKVGDFKEVAAPK